MDPPRDTPDFVAARVHGHWSRRLNPDDAAQLSQARSLGELLSRWPSPGTGSPSVTDPAELERELVRGWARETLGLARALADSVGPVLAWSASRVYLLDLHLRIRIHLLQLPGAAETTHLLHAAESPVSDWPAHRPFRSLSDLARQVPFLPLARVLGRHADPRRGPPEPETLARALDQAYHEEALRRAALSPRAERPGLVALAQMEGDGSPAERPGTEDARLRNLARTAWRVFRQRHQEPGAVVAYALLRWLDLRNRTTLVEGLRLGLPAEASLSRMTFLPPEPVPLR